MKLIKGKVNFVTEPDVVTDIENVEPIGRIISGENAGELVTIPFSEFSGGIDQDNIDIRKNVLTNSSDLTNVLAAINALPSYTVSQIQSVWFMVSVNENDTVSTYFYKLFNKGKGTYGVGGIQITRGDLGLINANVPAADEVESDPTTDIVNYGALTTQNVSEWLNTQTTPIVIQPQTDGYTLFKGTVNGLEQSYLFVGASGIYGVGQLQSTVSDFQLLSENATPPYYIPLTGTVGGIPVTGDIEFIGEENDLTIFSNSSDSKSFMLFGEGLISLNTVENTTNYQSNISVQAEGTVIGSNYPLSSGLTGLQDFTANATGDLDYVQRKGIAAMIAGASPNLTTDNTLYISDSDVIGLNIAGSDNEYFTYSSSNIFTVANNIANLRAVFRNGVKLKLNTDYTLTLPKTITILPTLVSGEEINPVYEYIINT